MKTVAILKYWFPTGKSITDATMKIWFAGGPAVDEEIRKLFGDDLAAFQGYPLDILKSPEETLATVILLDQISRNIHRGTGKMFAYDQQALSLAKQAVSSGLDQDPHLTSAYGPQSRAFFYLPFEHSESMEDQNTAVSLFTKLAEQHPEVGLLKGFLKYAVDHRAIIERFGRFPHRNALLGRQSSPQETEYLEAGGETFGTSAKK